MITLKDIKEAKIRLESISQKTPLTYDKALSDMNHANVYLKKENLQITGSFKVRGAYNKISLLSDEEKRQGVIACSAGNHAQGVAFAAKYFGIKATIVMPESTPLTKISGVKAFGAKVVLKGQNVDESYTYAKELEKQEGLNFVHPFLDDEVIAGQGTVALEILQDCKDVDIIICPLGGGGLISGLSLCAKALKPDVKVIGVVASGANAMLKSFKNKKAQNSKSVKTIADGIAIRDVSPKMLEYVLKYVDDIIEVDDQEIAKAVLCLLEKDKLLVEGAGAVGVAALMDKKIETKNKKLAIVLSGGNIDVTMLSVIIEKGLIKSDRKFNLVVTLVDKPGALMHLTQIFKSCDANIVQIAYDRNSVNLDFGDAYVPIALETKGLEHKNEIKALLTKNSVPFKEV